MNPISKVLVVAVLLCSRISLSQPVELKSGDMTNPTAAEFLNPPDPYKTGVWWHWILGSVDKEGIRADLDH